MNPSTAQPQRQASAIGFLFLINGIVFASWATNIPFIQGLYDLSEKQIGTILLVMAAGAVVFMSMTGYAVQSFGSRTIAMISSLGFAAALVLVFASSSYLTLIITVILLGAANGSMDVAMNQQAALYEKKIERPIMSRFHGGFSVGALLGSIATYVSINLGASPFQQALVTLILILMIAWYLMPSLMPDLVQPIKQKRKISLRKIRAGTLWILGLFSFLTMLSEGAIADWSALFLIDFSMVDKDIAALGYAAFAATMIVGRFSGDKLSDLLGCRTLVLLSGALTTTGMSMVLWMPSLSMKLAGFAVLGLGIANLVPVIFSTASKLESVQPSVGIAFVSVCGYSGFLIGPAFIGGAASAIGLDVALTIVVAVGVTAIAISQTFPGRT